MPRSERLACLAAGPLALLLPFVIFVHHHGYAPWRLEILVCAGGLALLGLVLSAGPALGPAPLKVALAAVLVTLCVDIQLDWIDSWSRVGVVAGAVALAAWPLRHRVGGILSFAAAVMIVTTLPLPSGGGWIEGSAPKPAGSPPADLPPIIHLVLDEHIGLEGIPSEFDRPYTPSRWIAELYADHGFTVFGGAFSRYYGSAASLSHLVNLSADPDRYRFMPTGFVIPNRYFEEMARRGYEIHVFQTDFMEFCRGKHPFELASCQTYTLESIHALESVPLSTANKVQVIAGMFARLPFTVTRARTAYNELVEVLEGKGIFLTSWPEDVGRVSALSTMAAIDRLQEQLEAAAPGSLHFAHLMLPHFPYAYDRECALRESPREWLSSQDPRSIPRRNSVASRRAGYPRYVDQVVCTQRRLADLYSALEEAGVLNGAIVIVHGDHGSRLDLGPPIRQFAAALSPADYVDAYSTFFAIKTPGGKKGYDPRPLPIDELFEKLVLDGRGPEEIEQTGDWRVFMTDGDETMVTGQMPLFAGGHPFKRRARAEGRATMQP